MKKRRLHALGLLLAACALAAPAQAQAQVSKRLSQAEIELGKSESLMSMRVDGELLIGSEGEVREHRVTTRVPTEIKALIDESIAQWRFEPINDEAGKPITAKTYMRMTVVARQNAEGDYTAQLENVRFHDGNKVDYRAEARENGIDVVVRPRPKYPPLMLGNGVNGSALLRVLFDADGKMQDAIVVQSAMFNVRGDSELLQRAVAEMEHESLQSVKRMRVKFSPEVNLTDASARAGYLIINFLMQGKGDDDEEFRTPGKWRQEQRGPMRAVIWLSDAARLGVSDFDGSESLISGKRSRIKPLSGVPTL